MRRITYNPKNNLNRIGDCMLGGIYSEQKCEICGSSFVWEPKRDGLFCPDHPKEKATGLFRVRFGRRINLRFSKYDSARKKLLTMQCETDEKRFDIRDHLPDRPMAFDKLSDQWLSWKQKEVSPGHWRNLSRYMFAAVDAWGDRNVKAIDYASIEDLVWSRSDISDKTRNMMVSCYRDFFRWLKRRRIIQLHQIPEFPEISFKLGFRTLIDKETQEAVASEVFKLSWKINPKIYIGIRFLTTYISIRPGEMLSIKEKDIILEPGGISGYLAVRYTKEKEPKLVPLLPEDVELIKSQPRGLPDLPYFRHLPGISGCKAGQPFGQKYFYKWWKRACENLGIEAVDLYGGTRHSSVCALGHKFSPEEIKHATMHATNTAFERYFRMDADKIQSVYAGTRTSHQNKGVSGHANICKLPELKAKGR